jgi:putative ABC transport system permease protein
VLKLIVGQAALLALTGVGLGFVASFLLTRLMESLLFGVSTTDPITFALVATLLIAVALVASYIPARRAMRVDPMIALRYE